MSPRARAGPAGALPLTAEMLRERPSGDLFGWTQNAGMGWNPSALGGKEFLMLSTHGGIRAPDGTPIALGYHTGHWEVGLLVEAAAQRVQSGGRDSVCGRVHRSVRRPNAGHDGDVRQPAVSQRRGDRVPPADPLAADAARRARRRDLRQGAAGDDDGAGGAATICPRARSRRRDAAARARAKTPARCRRIGVRFAHGEITLEEAADLGCRACASPGGGCQFLGTAATSQVVGEALGHVAGPLRAGAVGTADLARHGAPLGARADGARSTRHRRCATSSPMRPFATRWSCTRRSADRRTCCCTCRPSRTPPDCAGRPPTTGRGQSAGAAARRRAAERSAESSDGAGVSWPAACRK